MKEELSIYQRRLPHWRREGSVYFVTFRLRVWQLNSEEIVVAKNVLEHGHRNKFVLHAAVIMPDHVHLLIEPHEGEALSGILKVIKGTSARNINLLRKKSGSIWQDESFDRIVRTEAEFKEKMQYMYNNPLNKGLCENPETYVGWVLPQNQYSQRSLKGL